MSRIKVVCYEREKILFCVTPIPPCVHWALRAAPWGQSQKFANQTSYVWFTNNLLTFTSTIEEWSQYFSFASKWKCVAKNKFEKILTRLNMLFIPTMLGKADFSKQGWFCNAKNVRALLSVTEPCWPLLNTDYK